MDFSKKFNYCLCSICHNLLARIKKSKSLLTNQSKTPKSSSKSNHATRLTKSILQRKIQIEETDKVEETDEVEQIDDIEETDEIDETDEVEEIDEIGEIDEVEEIDEMEFEKGLTTNKNKAQILEYKNLEIVNIDVVNDLDDSEIDELDEDDIKESDCYIKEPSWKKKEISVNAISKESNLSEERTKVATNVRLIL
ncbi:hypothetical protein RclHR1_12300002 [Rhizophagus clarus]|uniref:Uncharacterized protein n=1 Tax=Rhizophagus clarus TaxID=94130 RepID=A0A2Z6QJ94_9GLOM|nr:hypothetical protein RclHR1_12300002 [Rhizophagus clarus]